MPGGYQSREKRLLALAPPPGWGGLGLGRQRQPERLVSWP